MDISSMSQPQQKGFMSKIFSPTLVLGEQVVQQEVHDVSSSQKSATGHEVFCVRYSPDGQFIAASRGNGEIDIYSTVNGNKVYLLPGQQGFDGAPTCCVRFRPNTNSSKTKNVLLSVNANGLVKHWHMTSMKCLHTINEDPNQCYALDYRADGLKFATAGQDHQVRIYDEATKTLQSTLTGGYGRTRAGHSNRVFSLKFSTDDENLLLSAGWDNTIQVWDIRMDVPCRSVFGTHITGDSIDLYDNYIVSGSWRPENQLQLWDLRTCTLLKNYNWTNASHPCLLYGTQFSKDVGATYIIAGGSGANEARLYKRESGEQVGVVLGMKQGVYSVDFHPSKSQVAIASGDGTVRLIDYQRE